MKKSDLATIVLIAGFTTILAFVLANAILGDPSEESVTVEYMDVISSDIDQPDQELFNAWAINPTVEIYVGQCRDGEIWDSESKQCISSAPEPPPTEDEEDEEDEEGNNEENVIPPTPEE